MDADTTWNGLCAAINARDRESAYEQAGALLVWLDSGGSPPREVGDEVTDDAKSLAARQWCLAVLAGGAP
jgi:hypothetical protein